MSCSSDDLSQEQHDALAIVDGMCRWTRNSLRLAIAAALLNARADGYEQCADLYIRNQGWERNSARQTVRRLRREAQQLREGI